MRRKLALIMALLMLSMMLISGAAAEQKKVTLYFTHDLVLEVEGGAAVSFNNALDRFRQANPDVEIVEDVLPDTECYTKIKTLMAADELPDLFVMRGDLLDTMVENEQVDFINEDLKVDPEWEANFLPGVFDVFTKDGRIYGVPTSTKSTSVVFWNEKIFKDCGFDGFFKTFDELKAAIPVFLEKGYTPIAIGNREQWVAQSCILSCLGDRFTGTDWFMSLKNNQGAKFTDPEFVASLQLLKDLTGLGAFNSDMNSLNNVESRTPFYNEKAAMYIDGAWSIGDVDLDGPKEVVAVTHVAFLPEVVGGKGNPMTTSGGASVSFAMKSGLEPEKRAAAVKVLRALSDKDYGSDMTEYNKFPAVKAGDYDESKISALAREYYALMEDYSFTPVYDIYLPPALSDMINAGVQEMMIGQISPEALAERLQTEMDMLR